METNSQLIKKIKEGRYNNIYPIAYIDGIIDKESNEKLSDILIRYNNIMVPWQGDVASTRNRVPSLMRRQGIVITYITDLSEIVTEVYKGTVEDIKNNWADNINWELVPDLKFVQDNASKLPDGTITPEKLSPALQELISQSGNVVNMPDDEDLEQKDMVLKFKDRPYNSELASGKGYKILRKNWTKVGTKTINLLTQDVFNQSNTIYEIRYDFDLNGAEITIPEGCILDFQGGSFSNGKVLGYLKNEFIYPEWFGDNLNMCIDLINDRRAKTKKLILRNKIYTIKEPLIIKDNGIVIEGEYFHNKEDEISQQEELVELPIIKGDCDLIVLHSDYHIRQENIVIKNVVLIGTTENLLYSGIKTEYSLLFCTFENIVFRHLDYAFNFNCSAENTVQGIGLVNIDNIIVQDCNFGFSMVRTSASNPTAGIFSWFNMCNIRKGQYHVRKRGFDIRNVYLVQLINIENVEIIPCTDGYDINYIKTNGWRGINISEITEGLATIKGAYIERAYPERINDGNVEDWEEVIDNKIVPQKNFYENSNLFGCIVTGNKNKSNSFKLIVERCYFEHGIPMLCLNRSTLVSLYNDDYFIDSDVNYGVNRWNYGYLIKDASATTELPYSNITIESFTSKNVIKTQNLHTVLNIKNPSRSLNRYGWLDGNYDIYYIDPISGNDNAIGLDERDAIISIESLDKKIRNKGGVRLKTLELKFTNSCDILSTLYINNLADTIILNGGGKTFNLPNRIFVFTLLLQSAGVKNLILKDFNFIVNASGSRIISSSHPLNITLDNVSVTPGSENVSVTQVIGGKLQRGRISIYNCSYTSNSKYKDDEFVAYLKEGDIVVNSSIDPIFLPYLNSGTFSNIPESPIIGFAYFCTNRQTTEGATNGIMIYHKGNNVWVDALGRVVE